MNMENMFPNRRWLIISKSLVENINFDQILEYSAENLRESTDGTKVLISYDILEVPETYSTTFRFAESGEEETTTVEAGIYGRPSVYLPEYTEYTYEQVLEIMNTEQWTKPIPE